LCGGLLRLLLRCQPSDASNEQDEFPGVGVVLFDVRIPPGGHAREANSILDDVVDCAVSQILRGGHSEIGRFRIKISPNVRIAVSVAAMTVCAAVGETLPGFRQDLRGSR